MISYEFEVTGCEQEMERVSWDDQAQVFVKEKKNRLVDIGSFDEYIRFAL